MLIFCWIEEWNRLFLWVQDTPDGGHTMKPLRGKEIYFLIELGKWVLVPLAAKLSEVKLVSLVAKLRRVQLFS